MPIDRAFQSETNGPLTGTARTRVATVKTRLGLTLAQIGRRFGFSGPIMSQLLREEDPARVRSKHIPRLRAALEQLEVEAGVGPPTGASPTFPRQMATMEDLIRAAHRLGFEISFKPLDR
jgi:hypothetical protein